MNSVFTEVDRETGDPGQEPIMPAQTYIECESIWGLFKKYLRYVQNI